MNRFVKRIDDVNERYPDVLLKDREKECNYKKSDSHFSERSTTDLELPQREFKGKGRVKSQKNEEV